MDSQGWVDIEKISGFNWVSATTLQLKLLTSEDERRCLPDQIFALHDRIRDSDRRLDMYKAEATMNTQGLKKCVEDKEVMVSAYNDLANHCNKLEKECALYEWDFENKSRLQDPVSAKAMIAMSSGRSLTSKTGKNLPSMTLIRNMRWNQRKGWIASKAEENYMVEIRSQALEGGEELTDGDIIEKVLGKRSGYVIGLGRAEVPPSRKARLMYNMDEVNQLRAKSEEQEQELIELRSWKASQLGRHPKKSGVMRTTNDRCTGKKNKKKLS